MRGDRKERGKRDAPDVKGAMKRLEQVERRLARLESSLEEIEQLLREMRRRK